jgi:hypothetical protein
MPIKKENTRNVVPFFYRLKICADVVRPFLNVYMFGTWKQYQNLIKLIDWFVNY